MKGKKFFIVGALSLALLIANFSVSYGSDKEICEKQIECYLKIKMNDGLLPGDEFNPYNFKVVEGAAKAMAENEAKRTHSDKNHAAITKLVTGHINNIETAAGKASEGSVEVIGHSLRFLYLSCKACHKVYRTEMRLRP